MVRNQFSDRFLIASDHKTVSPVLHPREAIAESPHCFRTGNLDSHTEMCNLRNYDSQGATKGCNERTGKLWSAEDVADAGGCAV